MLTRLTGIVLSLALAASAAGAAPQAVAAPQYSNLDAGFSEGAVILDADLHRRLDGMVSFLPGRSPILRIDLDWAYVEPCAGCAPRWDRLDPIVDAAVARGMRVLLILAYAPPWANGGHADDKWFPVADADWVSIVDRTVRHFGAKVQIYEVWNEPNNDFGGYAGDRRLRYWQLVRLANAKVHELCGACTVLAGASGQGQPGEPANESAAWLDWAYTNGYGDDFDAVAHHPYPPFSALRSPSFPECTQRWHNTFGPPGLNPPCGALAYVRSVMLAHGDAAKKIWGTEWGYPTAVNLPLATVRDHLAESVRMWRSLDYTGPLILYSYRDACAGPADGGCSFGVVRRDFTPKGVLFTDLSRVLAERWPDRLMPGERLRRWATLTSADGRFRLWLQGDGNLVLYRDADAVALWSSSTTDGVELINQPDGNLVLYRANGTPAWASGTSGAGPSVLWLHDDGNLQLLRPSWETRTGGV